MDEHRGGVLEIEPEQRAVVDQRLARRDLSGRERERLEMVKAAAVGYGEEASPGGAGGRSAPCGAG